MIENTAKTTTAEDAARILLLARMGVGTGEVERMESAGQRQLVESTDLPTQVMHGTDEEFLALGFTFGEPHPHDPLFRPATLPAGWKKQAKDHAMGSAVVDELGRERVSVFYKAAFYDRRADMSLTTVFAYVNQVSYEFGTPVLDTTWATPDAVTEAARGIIRRAEESVDLWSRPDLVAGQPVYSGERIAEANQTASWAEALITEIARQTAEYGLSAE